MGRAPIPTSLKVLRGWPGKRGRAIEQDGIEPEPPTGCPDEPDHIKEDPIAHAEWLDVCEQLDSMGLLAKTDRTMLELYCSAYSDWRRAGDMVKRYGDVLVTGRDKSLRISPYAKSRNNAYRQLKECLTELGLTPAARARMRTPAKNSNDAQDRWAGLVA